MAKGLAQRLMGNIGDKLFGVQTVTSTPGGQYPTELQEYLDDFENKPYVQDLLNKPMHERLTLDQYKQGFTQGLNFGNADMARDQQKLNINIPKTGEDINLAQTGDFNSYPMQATLTTGPRQGGFFNDLAKGYNENYSQKFDFDNLKPQNKNFATKTGEFLGSVGRFVDSPLGRGLLAAGLNKALGYDNSLQEGIAAFSGRQNAQTQDNLFRKSLIEDYGFSPEEIGGIKGNITKDLYNTIAANRYKQQSMQLKRELSEAKDNVSRARMISTMLNNGSITPQEAQLRMAEYGITVEDVQKSNQTRNTDMNEQLLPYKQYALQMSPQIALGNLAVAQGNLGLRQQMLPYDIAYKQYQIENMQNKNSGDKATMKAINENASTLADIDAGIQLINENPQAYSWIKGKMGADVANRIDPKGVATRAQIDNITAVYRKWLTGAQMSDQERKAYERFLPAPSDNAQIVKAKLNGMKNSIERKNQILMQGLNVQGQVLNQPQADPLGIL